MKHLIVLLGLFIICIPCNAQQQVFIEHVPDYSQPPAANLPSTVDKTNYCAPFAFLNIVEYWDSVQVHPYARGLMAGLPGKETVEYMGWFMDTNNQGSPARDNDNVRPLAKGTYVMDQWMGAEEYILFDNINKFLFPYSVPPQKISYGWDIQLVPVPEFMIFKDEIDLGNPVKLDFMYWSILPSGGFIFNPELAEDTVFIYDWSNVVDESGTIDENDPPESWNLAEGEGGIGHAVTAVGYLENYVADTSYVIVHDNWANTPKNITVPWINSKISSWFFFHLPEPPDLAVIRIQTANDTSVGFTDSLKLNLPVTVAVTIHNLGAGAAAFYMNTTAVENPLGNPVITKTQHLNITLDAAGTGKDSTIVYFDSLFTPTTTGVYNITSSVYWDLNGDSLENDSDDPDKSNDTLVIAAQVFPSSDIGNTDLIIQEFRLFQNYPNPFNPKTIISYHLPVPSSVELSIYNILGQKLATLVSEKQPAGSYNVQWDATGFSSGVYYYKIEAGNLSASSVQRFVQTKKLIYLK